MRVTALLPERWRARGAQLLVGLALLGMAGDAARAMAQAHAQTQAQGIAGVVLDPSGALVPGAAVALMPVGAGVPESTTESGPTGGYRLEAKPGAYTLVVQAEGFARFESAPIRLGAGSKTRSLDVRLQLEVQVQEIDVPADMDPASRGGTSVVLSGRDIAMMPLDSAALLDELQGIAGSKDAELFVDGFSGAKLPPRSSIREIRINQNPYSAQNDTNPVNGVIQVSTKPGTDKPHGEFYLYGDDSALNAGNPFAPNQPGYYAYATGADMSGPLNRRTSFAFAYDQNSDQINSVVDAQVLDASYNQAAFMQAVRSPLTTLTVSPRIDLQTTAHSTMTFRYNFARNEQKNGGIGQLALPSHAFDSSVLSNTAQVTDTQVIGKKMVNDTRFQYIRMRTGQMPVSSAPAIVVQGAFLGGGNGLGTFSDHQDRYELQNYIALIEGAHSMNFGGRLRVGRDANRSLANYNGEYIFSTLNAYRITQKGIAAGQSFYKIMAAGGGASQYSQNSGVPDAAVTLADAGLFFQDDWKARPTLTLSYGLRFETQTYIADHADWAPRAGFSWAFGRDGARYVLHGGAGIFYRRFVSDSALQVERQNGVAQSESVTMSPEFYCETSGMACGMAVPGMMQISTPAAATVYRVAPNFHAPYFVGVSVGLDRQLGRHGTASVTYLNNRGVHTQLTENINAPLPGTYTPGAMGSAGVRPLGGNQNIYEYVSEGVYRSNRISANLSLRASGRFTAYGYYMLRFDKNDADSGGGFPSNQYDPGVDYGRSIEDVRHSATIGGNANLPRGFHASGYLRAQSGAPFNIVVGQDLNGDTQYNDRPAFATDLSRAGVVATRWGVFDTSPLAGQTIIPRNYGEGPGLFLVNLAVGKSFGVGPVMTPGTAKAAPVRKYSLDFWAESQNLLNHPNFGPPVGTLSASSGSASLFGRSIAVTGASALSADRIVDLQMSLRF